MSQYIKSTDQAGISLFTHEGEENEIEHVNLGKIITNYPIPEGGEPIYSADSYATLALPASVPPANEVGLVDAQYIFDYVNHYFGAVRPG